MALKLAVSNKVFFLVKFEQADEGKIKKFAFTLICDRVNADEMQAGMKNDEGIVTSEKIREKMTAITTGWKDQNYVMDDDAPAVFGSNSRRAQVEAMKVAGVDEFDIPAFLRKQAD